MPGGGSIQGMRNSLSNNKKLLRSKSYFKKERSFLSIKTEYLKAAGGKIAFKKASKEDILKIRKKIIRQKRKENFILIALSVVVISIAVYFTRILIQQNEITVLKQEKIILQKKEREYLRLIEEGDHWLKKSHWHNARFDYKKAQEIFPNDYAVNYRILNAYILECENDCNNCNKAKNVLGKMIAAFTEKKLELMPLKEKLKTLQECLSLKG